MPFVDPDEVKGFQDPDAGGVRAAPAPVAATPITPTRYFFQPGWFDQQKAMIKPNMGAQWGQGAGPAAYAAGGAVTDLGAKMGLPPEVAAGAGYATNVGMQAVPALFGAASAGKAVGPALQSAGERIMQGALKPSKVARDSGDAAKAIRTMLDEGINVSKGGLEELSSKIGALEDKVTTAIANSPGLVNVNDAVSKVSSLAHDALYSIRANENLGVIKNAVQEFLDHPLVKGAENIPVQTAQAIKRGTYRDLGDRAYGIGLKPEAQRDTYKVINSGIRQGIEQAVPEVGPLNQQQGALINAKDLVESRLSQAGNRDVLGLGSLVAHQPLDLAVWLAQRWPLSASLAARGLYSGSEAIPMGILGAGYGVLQNPNK